MARATPGFSGRGPRLPNATEKVLDTFLEQLARALRTFLRRAGENHSGVLLPPVSHVAAITSSRTFVKQR